MLAAPQCEAAQWRARNAHYTSAYRHVMDPFYHLSDEERRRYVGSGLCVGILRSTVSHGAMGSFSKVCQCG